MAIVAQQGQPNQEENKADANAQPGQPQQLAGSSQTAATPAGSRLSTFSSGAPAGGQASGRFTNLSKYMNANKGASDTLGARANQTINKGFNQGQQQLSEQNKAIGETFQKANTQLGEQGTQFKSDLGNINQNLGSFKTFEDRGNFDQVGQQAQALAGNQQYQTLSQGNLLDQQALQNQQDAALKASQGLLGTANTNLQNIQTNEGRNTLFNQVLAPKQGYSAGARNFDKLFLGGALGGIQQNLRGKIGTAQGLLTGTQGQQQNVSDVTTAEANLLGELQTQNLANQNLFNEKLDTQANRDFVTNMRNKRFDDIMSGLKSGTVSKDVANQLGLTGLDTYANTMQTPEGKTQAQKNLIGTYRLLDDAGTNYFSRGEGAQSFQDIATEQDFQNSQALAALSGQAGKLQGTSQLGSSIVAAQGKDMTSLAKDIQAQNKSFMDQYAGKDITQGGNYITSGGRSGIGSGASSTANIDKYLQSGSLDNITKSAAAEYNYSGLGQAARDQYDQLAIKNSTANLKNELDRIARTTGVKNTLEVTNQVDPLTQRFRGLL